MSTECKILKHWDDWLENIPKDQSGIYFTEAYHRLHETRQDTAECFLYRDGLNTYLFPYLKRENHIGGETFFDLESAYGYGGPVANTQDATFLAAAESAFFMTCRQHGFIAGFVRFCPWIDNVKLITDPSSVMFDRHTVLMDLRPSNNQIWEEQIHAKNRNVIRKAEREGLTFKVDADFEHLNEFMHIYNDTMHRLEASEFYRLPASYFRRLKETLHECAVIGLVCYQEKIISAAIFLHQRDFAHYHLSGSLVDYQFLAPNNLLLYRAALYFKQAGANFFHLGGGSDNAQDNTLLKFKRRFSPNIRNFHIGKFVFDPEQYDRICRTWAEMYKEHARKFDHIFLKYRNTKESL